MSAKPWQEWIPGVLSDEQVGRLKPEGYIQNSSGKIDFSSFDLTLGGDVYEMLLGSVKPFGKSFEHFVNTETKFVKPLEWEGDGTLVLTPKKTYLFKLKEKLGIGLRRSNIYGQATAKSSVGRVDVLARLIVDGMDSYEGFTQKGMEDSSGTMYLEVTSITFRVRVKSGISLSQLRLFYGEPENCEIRGKELYQSVLISDPPKSDNCLSVDLSPTRVHGESASAFRAKRCIETPIDLWEKGKLEKPNPLLFWDFDVADEKHRLRITETNFYILRSKEKILLPRGVCVYCRAIDETIGEMRIHYAGFVHPYFGRRGETGAERGSPLIFEVRGHDVNVTLNDNEKLATLTFYRMSEDCRDPRPEELSRYTGQILKLSNFFGDFPQAQEA